MRIEERFYFNSFDLDEGIDLRIRILPTLTYKFQGDIWNKNKGSYIFANTEFFIDMLSNAQFTDLIRLNTGIGRYFDNGLRAEFVLGFFMSKLSGTSNFQINDYIFRFRFFYTNKDKNTGPPN